MGTPASDPLSPEDREELEEAGERARRFLKAGRVATFNVWTLGAFAGITLLFGLFSPEALVLGMGMGVVTWNEHRGRTLLRDIDPEGPRALGRNQLGLMALIVTYALWSLWQARTHPDPGLARMDELMGGDTAGLVAELTTAVYLGVTALTILFQGLLARYYFARAPMVETYLRETPEWVVQLQRSASLE
ncbi:MAG: hypothetical protein RQ745_04880 [Longimicrobiales bacterium]|nr:hypothetical protein [Longimicrobiales bacterium]